MKRTHFAEHSQTVNTMFLVLLTLAVVLWYALFRYKRRRVYELAKQIPSPPDIATAVGLYKYLFKGTEPIMPLIEDYSSFALKHNGIVKLLVDPYLYVAITNREDAEFVLKNCLDKDDLMVFFKEVIGNAGIYAQVSTWIHRRKMLLPAFGPKVLKGFVDIQSIQAQMLAEQLSHDNRVGTGPFSIWPYISAYTLSSVSETALGVKLDALRNPNIPFLKAVSDVLSFMTRRLVEMWLWPEFIYKCSPLHASCQKSSQILYSFTDKIIQEKREALNNLDRSKDQASKKQTIFGQDSENKSFLDHLLILSADGNRLNNLELREEILVMLLAGTDSSAVAIGYTLMLLAKYPQVQEKLYAELINVFGDDDRKLKEYDLKQLDYLNKVVKESLRLFTPVPIVARKSGTEEMKLPSGTILPPGTGCVLSLWGINRDPKYWGADADCFKPERFCDDELVNLATFSLGPRNCIGYQYALQSVKIAVSSIVRHYKVVGEVESSPVPRIDSVFSIMMRAKDDFKISLEKR